jgi:hypothetical protein
VIFEHLYELSDGKLNMIQSTEELISTSDLLRRTSEYLIKFCRLGKKFKAIKIQKQANQKHTKTIIIRNSNATRILDYE